MKIKKSVIVHELLQFDFTLQQYIDQTDETLIFDMPNTYKSKIGGLVVQLVNEEDIWIRNYHPFSPVCLDSIKELKLTIEKILSDELIWAIGFDNGEWYETTLNYSNQELKLSEGIEYKILSWSGKLDKDIIN